MSVIFNDGHFAGSVLGSRRVGDLTLAETQYAPSFHVPAHAHDHAICCLVLNGGFTEHAGRTPRTLDAGTLLFHPAQEAHAHDFHRTGGHCFNIQFGTEWTRRIQDLDVAWPTAPADLQRSRARWIAEQLRNELAGADAASDLIVEGYALAMLGEVARSASPKEKGRMMPAWLRRAMEILHEQRDLPLSLADMAATVGVHPTHLARTFRTHFGCSMGEYLRKIRIEAASRQLSHTNDALAEIALDAGFTDQAHFSRVFKQVTGLTPGAYRKNSRSR